MIAQRGASHTQMIALRGVSHTQMGYRWGVEIFRLNADECRWVFGGGLGFWVL